MEWGLLFLLLPVAALSGWLVGRRKRGSQLGTDCVDLSADYFKGLNFLLNEQSDKAIEVFVRMLEIDSETVDVHFALGNLFLRRGEVDRAIRIHQNLIARPSLTTLQRQQALFELGRDYLRAGLLDRAEALFKQVAGSAEFRAMALRQLLEVYQLEKEWLNARMTAEQLARYSKDRAMGPMVAQFLCEQAEDALKRGDDSEAAHLIREANIEDKNSVRVTLLDARLNAMRGDYRNAIRTLRRIEEQDPAFVTESLPYLVDYFQKLNANDELINALEEIFAKHPSNTNVAILLAKQLAQRDGERAAIEQLFQQVSRTPSLRGVCELMEYKQHQHEGLSPAEVEMLGQLIRTLLEGKPAYRCKNCGFTTRTLHWQCPSCKSWNSIRPMQNSEIE